MPKRHYCGKLASVLLLFVGTLAIAACSKKSASEYIQSAQVERQNHNLNGAIIDLKNALQVEPSNQQARLLLARYYLEIPDPVSAQGELLRAKQDGVDETLLAEPLAEADLMLNHPSDALKVTEAAANVASSEAKADILGRRAEALMALGRMQEAHEALLAGSKADPKSIIVSIGEIRYALAMKDSATAQQQLTAALQKNPSNSELIALEGDIAFLKGDYDSSEHEYSEVLQITPWSLPARIELAKAQVAANKLKEANGTIAIVLKASPNNPFANYFAALIAYREGKFADAQSHIQRTLSGAPDFTSGILLAGATDYALKNYEQANSYLDRYVYLEPQSVPARKLLAATEVALGRSRDAVNTLLPALGNNSSDAQLLAMIGDASARSGDLVHANGYLTQAVARQPGNPGLRTQLGVTRVALGETNSGVEELQKAIEQNPNALPPETALFVTYLRTRQFDKALDLAKRLEQSPSTAPMGYDYTGLVLLAQGNKDAAHSSFLKARELKPGDPLALRSLAALAVQDNDFGLAQNYLEEIIKDNPGFIQAYIDLAGVQARTGHSDQVQATIQKAIDQNPSDPGPRIAFSQWYLLEGKPRDALGLISPALSKDSKNPALLAADGRIQLVLKNFGAAMTDFTTLVSVQPNSGPAHLDLAQAYVASGNLGQALVEAQNATRLAPNNEGAKIFLVQVLMAKRDYPAAQKVVDQMTADNSQDVNAATLSGDIATALNRPDQAVASYKRAVAINDNSSTRVKLAQALQRANQSSDAEQTLVDWLAGHPDDPNVELALGGIYIVDKKFAEAETQYSKVLKVLPDNFMAENNLAWLLSQAGHPSEALPHAQHAAALAPTMPDVLDTYGIVLLRNNQASDAISELRKAVDLAPNAPEIKFHLAEALFQSGSKEEARNILNALISSRQPFNDLEKAKKMAAEP